MKAKKKGAITTQRGKGQVAWEFRGTAHRHRGGGVVQMLMPKKDKAKAAEKKRTGGTQRERSEGGHQEGPQAACGCATARR